MKNSIARELHGLHYDGPITASALQRAIDLQLELGAITKQLHPVDLVDVRFLPNVSVVDHGKVGAVDQKVVVSGFAGPNLRSLREACKALALCRVLRLSKIARGGKSSDAELTSSNPLVKSTPRPTDSRQPYRTPSSRI